MTEATGENSGDAALRESYSEQAALDDLLVKLATGGFGFSVSLAAFTSDPATSWLRYSWFVLVASVLLVVLSKFVSVAALRAHYVSVHHEDHDERGRAHSEAERFGRWVGGLNIAGGVGVGLGALLVAIHVAS